MIESKEFGVRLTCLDWSLKCVCVILRIYFIPLSLSFHNYKKKKELTTALTFKDSKE